MSKPNDKILVQAEKTITARESISLDSLPGHKKIMGHNDVTSVQICSFTSSFKLYNRKP